MPQYAPLPPIDLDPRTESELVAAAARRVYEASGSTINDFSSGSPIVALLEGQAFAQAEFLQFANQFPESVLIEWIGPFLGAQRRTGAGATATLTVNITPRDQEFVVFAGFEIATDPNLTGGESIGFVTTERLIIPAGESSGDVNVVALFRGVNTNVAANTIVRPVTSLEGVLSVFNAEAASGGQDPELLSEVKERFFTLIRRRNPVSAEDWVDFFSDALGPGASVSVLARRSEKDVYRYDSNFVEGNPSVAFFVLNPDGTPLTETQRGLLQNLVKWALPTEFLGTVYSMEVDDVDIELYLQYDPTKPYASDLRTFSKTVRDNLYGILTPNAVFPVSYSPNVNDVEGALTTSFPPTLGTTNQYIEPDIAGMKAYVTPQNIALASFTSAVPKPFATANAVKAGDLVVDETGVTTVFYEALEDFTPMTGDKPYHTNVDDLKLTVISTLTAKQYTTGEVILNPAGAASTLHVVLTEFEYEGIRTPSDLISGGFISAAKTFSDFTIGGEFLATNDDGVYDPQILAYERDDTAFEPYEPALPTDIPANKRVGYPVWVVNKNFSRVQNTTNLGVAQSEGLVSTTSVTVDLLETAKTFYEGEYIKTPSPEELLLGTILSEACYVDQTRGALQVFAKVIKSFTFVKDIDQDYKSVIDTLVAQGYLQIVSLVPFVDCAGRASFSAKPFRYEARFRVGEYIRYRPLGGFNAAELEECVRISNECSNVTPACRRLLEANLPLPSYFYVLKDFTPGTQSVTEMIRDGLIFEVPGTIFRSTYNVILPTFTRSVSSPLISTLMISQGAIASEADLIPAQTVTLLNSSGQILRVYVWTGTTWVVETGGLPVFRDMFRFAPGDAASFRNGATVRQYEATQHVTPILDLESYFDNGIFVRSERSETVKYYDPLYHYEDVVYDITPSSTKFYRAIRSFTPPAEVTTWAGETTNTPRAEEVFRHLLKFVNHAEGSDMIMPRLTSQASTNKLGTVNITLQSKSTGGLESTFVWESTDTATATPQLSYFPRTPFQYTPVNYGNGTLAL